MQFGIEIPGYFKWSLAQYVYAQWAGFVWKFREDTSMWIGASGFMPIQVVGIMPEITVIELKKRG
jgi:hypothetical protein